MKPAVAKRSEIPEIRKQQILDAARRCFRKVGFHATTVGEVAVEAGVSVGLIYKHFPSKEALIEGIVLADMDARLLQIGKILRDNPDNLLAAMSQAFDNIVAGILDRDRTALMVEIAAETIRNPRIHKFVEAAQEQIWILLRERMAAQQSKTLSAEQMEARIQILGGILQGMAIQLALQKYAPDATVLQVLKETVTHLLAPDRITSSSSDQTVEDCQRPL